MARPSSGIFAAIAVLIVLAAPTAASAASPGKPHAKPTQAPKVKAPKVKAAAAQSPLPVFDCAADNGDGTTEFFFSYSLPGDATVSIKVGGANDVDPDHNVGQPTLFQPGTHSAFSVVTGHSVVRWRLAGHSAEGNAGNLCTTPPIVAEAGSWLVLPAATAGPLLIWFGWHVRRQRRAGVAPSDELVGD